MLITAELRRALQRYMDENRLSQRDLGRLLKASGPTISRWMSGDVTSVSQQTSERLMQLLGITQDQLARPVLAGPGAVEPAARGVIRNTPLLREFVMREILGRGYDLKTIAQLAGYDRVETLKRLLDGQLDWYPAMLSGVLTALGVSFSEAPISEAERALLHPSYREGFQTRDVPVLSFAHAASCPVVKGAPEPPSFWEGERLPVPTDGRKYVAFRVDGDSMAPLIRDGQIVLCDPQAEVFDGQVVVAKFDDQVVCKRFRRHDDTVLLRSDNPGAGQDFELPVAALVWVVRAVRCVSSL